MLGHHNTRKIELAEALDKGKGYLINAQTVLIDEAKSSGSWSEKAQLINTLKTIITEGTIGVDSFTKNIQSKTLVPITGLTLTTKMHSTSYNEVDIGLFESC